MDVCFSERRLGDAQTGMLSDVFVRGELVSVRDCPPGGSDNHPNGECSELYVGLRKPEKEQNARQPDGRKPQQDLEVIPGVSVPSRLCAKTSIN